MGPGCDRDDGRGPAEKWRDALSVTCREGYTDDAQGLYNCRIRAILTTVFPSFEGRVSKVRTGSINCGQLEATAGAILEEE